MAAGSKSHLIQNPREIVVSSDLTRIGQLLDREQQNADQAKSVRADFYTPASGTIDDFGNTNRGTASLPISGALVAPSLDGQAGSLNMLIGAGEIEFASGDTSAPDVSAYQTARWAGQPITWPGAANPHGSYPRIATICVTPGDSQDDVSSRNILLNPTTRQYEPQDVPKTSNPSGTISVVAGTAATVPFPPAVPSGAYALFDVLMPAGTTQSSDWLITRRCWRRIEFPGSSQHGILKDCVPTWAYAAEGAGSVTKLVTASRIHRPVIDGELLTFSGSGYIPSVADTSNAPGSAPAGNDLPTYLYLCGGRNWPYAFPTYGGGAAVPVVLVESTTPPDVMGYPSAALTWAGSTIPRAAALFIGNAFRIAGGTLTKSVFYDGDWVRPQASTVLICGFKINSGDHFTTGSASPVSLVVGGIPAGSTAIELQASIDGQTTTYPQSLVVLNGVGGSTVIRVDIPGVASVVSEAHVESARVRIARPGSDTIQYTSVLYTGASTATVDIRATAFNMMNIPRISK